MNLISFLWRERVELLTLCILRVFMLSTIVEVKQSMLLTLELT